MKWFDVPIYSHPHGPHYLGPLVIRCGVIGDPVDHSLSPQMQEAALEALGIPGEYLSIEVPQGDLEAAIEHLKMCGLHGLNVTLPHKQNAYLLRFGDTVVRTIGATNTVKFGLPNSHPQQMNIPTRAAQGVHATNTDAQGFFWPIRNLPKGRAMVLGAGGAAAAVAFALYKYGWEFSIWNRSSHVAQELATKYGGEFRDEPSPRGCSLVVNATPIGLREGEEPPLLWEHLEQGATVYDLAYRQGPTDFLSHALLEGAAVIDGREMLVGQGAVSLNWWLGVEPPVDAMRKAVGI